MYIQLDAQAAANFDKKAEVLLAELSVTTEQPTTMPKASFTPPFNIVHCFKSEEIINLQIGECDAAGRNTARWFHSQGHRVGLEGNAYTNLVRLAEQMQGTNALRTFVSRSAVEDAIFEWLRQRYSQALTTPMTEMVVPLLDAKVTELEIWIPIHGLSLETDLMLGPVKFLTITPARLERWFRTPECPSPQYTEEIYRAHLAEMRGWQGYAAATMSLFAEPTHAYQVVLEATETALALLRFFSEANMIPGATSYILPRGKENLESDQYLVIHSNERALPHSGISDRSFRPWVLSEETMRQIVEAGLPGLCAVAFAPKKTEFQQALLDAFFVYSRHSLAKSLSDELIYVFTALDSFLLQDASEPIQQNIGERLAFTISSDGAERMAIVRDVKKAYGLRSRIIHHAAKVDEVDVIQRLLLYVWRLFLLLFHRAALGEYKTKGQYFEYVNRMKFYSPTA